MKFVQIKILDKQNLYAQIVFYDAVYILSNGCFYYVPCYPMHEYHV